MISELKALFEYYEKEKGIDREKMVEALSQALLAASKKSIGPARGACRGGGGRDSSIR